MNQVASTLGVAFECLADKLRQLRLDRMSQLRVGRSTVMDVLHLFPAVSADLYPSIGGASYGKDAEREIVDIVQFSGSTRAPLSYPLRWGSSSLPAWPGTSACSGGGAPSTSVSFSTTRVSTEILQAYDSTGADARPSISYDSQTNELVAELAIVGAVRATYMASYREVFVTRSSDQRFIDGEVVAAYQGVMAKASLGRSDTNEHITVYDVTSEYLADENGAWEVPPEWPEQNIYPSKTTDPLPNQAYFQLLERVHETATLTQAGDYRYRDFHVEIEQPYEADAEYKPQYKFERGRQPIDAAWLKVWEDIDWDSIEADVSARYPGIEIPSA